MKRRTAVLLALFVVPLLALYAQDVPCGANKDTVTVSADGHFDSPPDTVVVNFNIAVRDSSQKEAYARAQQAAEQIRQVMRQDGLDPKQAEIGYFQVSPVYDWSNNKRKFIAYQVSSAVTLKIRDFGKVATLAEQFSTMQISDSQTISYMLENMEEAKGKAIRDSYAKARAYAQQVAAASGRTLGELVSATLDDNTPIVYPRMMKAQMAGAAPAPTEEFSPSKIETRVHLRAVFALK